MNVILQSFVCSVKIYRLQNKKCKSPFIFLTRGRRGETTDSLGISQLTSEYPVPHHIFCDENHDCF